MNVEDESWLVYWASLDQKKSGTTPKKTRDSLASSECQSSNRRRSVSDPYTYSLGLDMASINQRTLPHKQRRSSLLVYQNFGSNIPFQSPPNQTYTVRMNIIQIYLKYVIQAGLYCILMLLTLTVLNSIAPYYGVWIPLVFLSSLYLATDAISHLKNQLHLEGAHETSSLIHKQNLLQNVHEFVDQSANYSLRFFSKFTSYLARSSLLDSQIDSTPSHDRPLNSTGL